MLVCFVNNVHQFVVGRCCYRKIPVCELVAAVRRCKVGGVASVESVSDVRGIGFSGSGSSLRRVGCTNDCVTGVAGKRCGHCYVYCYGYIFFCKNFCSKSRVNCVRVGFCAQLLNRYNGLRGEALCNIDEAILATLVGGVCAATPVEEVEIAVLLLVELR